ncbi:hypothetical protein ACJX0J_022421, partial [Zea mays]
CVQQHYYQLELGDYKIIEMVCRILQLQLYLYKNVPFLTEPSSPIAVHSKNLIYLLINPTAYNESINKYMKKDIPSIFKENLTAATIGYIVAAALASLSDTRLWKIRD